MNEHQAAETLAMFCRLNAGARRREMPVRASEFGMLLFLSQQETPQTPLSIARYFQVSKPMISAAIRRLALGGYVRKQVSDTDRRSYYPALTDKGQELVAWAFEAYCESARLLSDAFGEDAFAAFVNQLAYANDVLSANLRKRRPADPIESSPSIHLKEEKTMFGSPESKIEKLVEKKNASGLVKFLTSKDESVRVAAIKALGKVPSEETFNTLTALVRNPSAAIRAAAAIALGTLGDPKARAFIEHASATEQDATVKAAISEALGKLHDQK